MLSPELNIKLEALKENLRGLGSLVVAFSAGVDSSLLLSVAAEVLGDKVTAVSAVDVAFPLREKDEAESFCRERNIRHEFLQVDPLQLEEYRHNAPDRCYHCKKSIFSKILKYAEKEGITHVAEGSNLDDTGDYRPGMKAISELNVLSPLKDAGLTKEDIRLISKELGLPTWDKPSYACLASRFVYGEEITKEKLRSVDRAEQFLIDLGFRQERVRLHGNLARIEVPEEDIPKLTKDNIRKKIYEEFKKAGFSYVTIDMLGFRSGSMNETLKVTN